MSTPGKEAYSRKKRQDSDASSSHYTRKKAAMNGSDAKTAYVRKKQDVNRKGTAGKTPNVQAISKSLRARIAGGAD